MGASLDEIWQGLSDRAAAGGTSLIINENALTWTDLFEELRSARARLDDRGVVGGDVILLQGTYSLNTIVYFFALALRKCIVIPITNMTDAKDAEISKFCPYRFRISEIGTEMEISAGPSKEASSDGTGNPKIEKLRMDDRAGLVLLSSGTTGAPKIILHDLSSLLEQKFKNKTNEANRILVLLLFDHIGGINTLISTVLSGGVCVIPSDRSVDQVGHLIETYSIRTLPSSPSFLNLMLLLTLLHALTSRAYG